MDAIIRTEIVGDVEYTLFESGRVSVEPFISKEERNAADAAAEAAAEAAFDRWMERQEWDA